MAGVLEQQHPVAFGLTHRTIAVLVIILVLLLSGVAIGVIDWNAVFQNTYREVDRREVHVEDWNLQQKKDIVYALQTAGYNVSSLPSLNGKSEEEQDRILTIWINKQTDGEVNDWLFNV